MELLSDEAHVEARFGPFAYSDNVDEVHGFAPNVLLGDEAQVEACLSLFGVSPNLEARQVHGLCRMYHRLGNHHRHTRWNS
jgi:hypothetical protein